jgi:peptidoglycan hydrolase-like protein with peptidoglycan-binding domain
MRFKEFKIVKEATEGFYTIGDSHAVAVATAGGKDWTNLAIGGRSSTDSEMLGNISKVPKGATVLVSQGANDTANAMRASMDSKKPPKDPKAIAANVANVVNKVQAQGANVIFMLFPNGPGRGAGLAKYYGGDYQEEVRNAIKSAIDVPIIDINGKPLTDGVHATMGVYKDVANQVKAKSGAGVTLGPAGATPGAPRIKDKEGQGASPSADQLDVPTSRRGPDVRDVQQALLALGYELPKHGADGIRGRETVAAVSKFQSDNQLTVDGDPGPETVGKLNELITKKNIKIKKSTPADVKVRPTRTSTAGTVGSSEIVPINDHPKIKEAKESAEQFLGRRMDDAEWNELVRATGAEASNNTKECAFVMAVILNRTRKGYNGGSTVNDILHQANQFQAVTGTKADGHSPSKWFTQGPSKGKLDMIVDGAINILPSAPKDIYRFTAANRSAYGAGTTVAYLDKLKADGGVQIGGTIFA